MDEKQVGERPVVHLRVVAVMAVVAEDVATKVSEFLQGQGYEVIEQTSPRQGFQDPNEYRVFLTVR